MPEPIADPTPWVHDGFRSANQYEPPYPFFSTAPSGKWAPRPEFGTPSGKGETNGDRA